MSRCILGHKRHWFTEYGLPGCKRETCARCGAQNPNWDVILLVKPARRPRWWPKNGHSAAWATIHWDGKWVLGYSIGIDRSKQFRRRQAEAARRRWNEEYDYRKWAFKEIPTEPWDD